MFLRLGNIRFRSMEKALLSSLWNTSIDLLSDSNLLYHHICTNVHALTPLPGRSPSVVSRWNNDISSDGAGLTQTGQSPHPSSQNKPLLSLSILCNNS